MTRDDSANENLSEAGQPASEEPETPAERQTVQFSVVFDDDAEYDVPTVDSLDAELTADAEPPSIDPSDTASRNDADAADGQPHDTDTADGRLTAHLETENIEAGGTSTHIADRDNISEPTASDAWIRHSDDILLKSYPTFALDHVTVRNRKSGRAVLSSVQMPFYAGQLYAVSVNDDEQRTALLAVMGGFVRPDSGQVMLKSANINELEINEIRGHRIALVPQRFALREDLDAVANLVYAMEASGRTFLKPKPVLARELLASAGCDDVHAGEPVRELSEIERRRTAVARAICCEATAVVIDEPTAGLGGDETKAVLALLATIAHTGDPKRCVIMLTSSAADIDAADTVYDVDD